MRIAQTLYTAIASAALSLCAAVAAGAQENDSTLDVQVENAMLNALPVPHDAILFPSPQHPLLIGPYAGADYAIHRGSFLLTENGLVCCEFEKGAGRGYTAGLRAFFPIGESAYLSPRAGYTRHAGEFSTTSDDFPFFGAGDTVEMMHFNEDLKTPLPAFAADLFYCLRIDSSLGLYVGGGPAAEYIASARFTKTERIEDPSGLTYLNGTTLREEEVDYGVDAAKVLFGGRLGLLMLYPLGESVYLNPEVTLGIPITVVSDHWRMFEVQGTMGIMIRM